MTMSQSSQSFTRTFIDQIPLVPTDAPIGTQRVFYDQRQTGLRLTARACDESSREDQFAERVSPVAELTGDSVSTLVRPACTTSRCIASPERCG